MGPMARAASISGTATRMIWHPACSRRRIWDTVRSTSWVGVLHMDWMLTGAPPPTATAPTWICLLMVLSSCNCVINGIICLKRAAPF